MKKIITAAIAVLCLMSSSAFAQDIISMRNGQQIRAKVIEVTETSVKYVLFDENDGPVYTTGKTNISSIAYNSGRTETFTRSSSYAESYYNNDGRAIPESIVPGMKYKEYAKLYNPRDYVKRVDDRYSPVWGGVCSFLTPGLGQMINGEVGRGFMFLGIHAGCYLVEVTGAMMASDTDLGVIIALLGAAGIVANDVWAIVDGVRVGKIKNLYDRDSRDMAAIDLKMEPYFALSAPSPAGQTPVAGLKFSLAF